MAWRSRLDHDDFGSNRSKIINVIDSNILERDAGGKPLHTFPHPALGSRGPRSGAIWRAVLNGRNPSRVPVVSDAREIRHGLAEGVRRGLNQWITLNAGLPIAGASIRFSVSHVEYRDA
jgi:hypothetical protein